MSSMETIIARTVISAIANADAEFMHGTVRAVHEDVYLDALGMSNSGPSLQCVSVDIACVAAGDKVLVTKDNNRAGYTVREVQPDGRGVTRLVLEIV